MSSQSSAVRALCDWLAFASLTSPFEPVRAWSQRRVRHWLVR